MNSIVSRVPLGRQGAAEEVVALVVHPLSPAAAYVTGQSVVVDSGLLPA